MATAPKKKTVIKPKAPVVSTKKIVHAASKAAPARSATKKATVTKPVVKASAPNAVRSKKTVALKNNPAPSTNQTKTLKPALPLPPSKERQKKPKLVRDSFTMPETEYAVLSEVKKTCIAAGIEVKKSQLLRVGLVLLKKTELGTLKGLIGALAPLKAGRPKAEK